MWRGQIVAAFPPAVNRRLKPGRRFRYYGVKLSGEGAGSIEAERGANRSEIGGRRRMGAGRRKVDCEKVSVSRVYGCDRLCEPGGGRGGAAEPSSVHLDRLQIGDAASDELARGGPDRTRFCCGGGVRPGRGMTCGGQPGMRPIAFCSRGISCIARPAPPVPESRSRGGRCKQMTAVGGANVWTSTGTILVLFILLVIISRTFYVV